MKRCMLILVAAACSWVVAEANMHYIYENIGKPWLTDILLVHQDAT